MRSLLTLLFLGLLIFLVAGWFLDWYDISKVRSEDGKSSYQVDINRDKIKEDLHKGGQKLNDTLQKKSSSPTPPAQTSTSGNWSPVPR